MKDTRKINKLIGLKKSTVAKLIVHGDPILEGVVQQVALLEGIVDKKEFTAELLDY
ncbi:hypothetical protein [uncultured Dokdonia sp.]|uniref:hypothetical protein n=1 Tax=uncultured Dokdonia sp. TaxID=575653 RepID=UPI002607E958|nr:hypothetical protein [uncultured Dokdonia sp.]